MFKKLIGSLAKDNQAAQTSAIDYTLPESMPNLNADLNAMLPKIKLPDSVKKHIPDPAMAATNPEQISAPDPGQVATDVAAEAAVETLEGAEASDVGQVLASAVENADGESTPFLAAILTDPRFAIIGVNFLAFGLKKETAILWAVECTSLGYAIANEQNEQAAAVEMSPAEELAMERAKAYANGETVPAEELSQLAADAGMDKPGALAAQAAAWDQAPPPPEAGDPDALIGDMVAGAVLLSAALTIPEEEKPQISDTDSLDAPPADAEVASMDIVPADSSEAEPMAKRMKPFIDKGLELAAAG